MASPEATPRSPLACHPLLMCGRYSLTDLGDILLRLFELPAVPAGHRPRYNIAPTQSVTTILAADGQRQAASMRWGLIPSWAKDVAIGNKMINARAETVAEKPAFRTALRRRRCIIPADGFYEWQVRNGKKQPVRFVPADGGILAFAGLWECWRQGEGKEVRSFTIITTAANDFVRPVHDRMPVILPHTAFDLWLDPTVQDAEAVLPLLTSAPEDALRVYDVSTLVNSPRNERPECIEALAG